MAKCSDRVVGNGFLSALPLAVVGSCRSVRADAGKLFQGDVSSFSEPLFGTTDVNN